MSRNAEVTFVDELLSGGGVFRRYSDGVKEWRWRDPDGVVWWRDNRQHHGTDEALRERLVKRSHLDGRVVYGRDIGFGWTAWNDGRRTLNVTGSPSGLAAMLVRVGSYALLSARRPPPLWLSPTEEERLRRRPEDREREDREPPDDLVRAGDDHRDDLLDDFG
ncbi:hypothetical protein [Virgisporangium aurantiacum]|uniref:Uncharacterized protein n=1 Tax=Virgisporangium aurantiacum TaxID=175570 RepID=A0A8J3ZHH5_9ACTN|nr:hypothetical protein [Virgisporangium aurantiacum]GIJ64217.1 hypothetical protein Vau01_117330 [Virgisporangium aurantiacum]